MPAAVIASSPFYAPSIAQIATFNGNLIHGANIGTLFGPPVFAAVVSGSAGWTAGGTFMLGVAGLSVVVALTIRRIERGLGAAAIASEASSS